MPAVNTYPPVTRTRRHRRAAPQRAARAAHGQGWVALYTRVSKDEGGDAVSPRTQAIQGRAYCDRTPELQGLPIEVYTDNDLSAFDPSVERPDYDRLRADIAAGRVAFVVAREQARLERYDWQGFATHCLDHGVPVVHFFHEGVLDLANPGDWFNATVKGGMNRLYSAQMSANIHGVLSMRLDRGLPKTGGAPYGYRWGLDDAGERTLIVIPEQAAILQEVAGRVIAGEAMRAIVRDLTARGVETARGGRWQASNLRQTLEAPTLRALQVERGEVVGQGSWEPILSDDLFRRLQASFPKGRNARPAREHLLTGLALCGRCGRTLNGRSRPAPAKGRERDVFYTCNPDKARRDSGCGLSILHGDQVESLVVQHVKQLAQSAAFVAMLREDRGGPQRAALEAQAAEIAEERAGWLADVEARRVKRADWLQISQGLDAAAAEVDAALRELEPADVPDNVSELVAQWDDLSIDVRQSLVRTFLASVTIAPPRPGANRFDPGRIQIVQAA